MGQTGTQLTWQSADTSTRAQEHGVGGREEEEDKHSNF